MIGVKKCSSISYLPTFGVENIWTVLKTITVEDELIIPDYKTLISSNLLRRFSPILRSSYAAALTVQEENEVNYDAIVIGTGLGCLKDTEKFLQSVIAAKGESISPTAFIHSTHNTIGGALSIGLKNHAYNMTHTQGYFSFEWALLDSIMLINEGNKNILLGAADEHIDFLNRLQPTLLSEELPLTSGATFVHLCEDSDVQVIDLQFTSGDLSENLSLFLAKNNCSIEDIDIQLLAKESKAVPTGFQYTVYSGNHQCHSAFAFHLAVDAIRYEHKKRVLILNNHYSDRQSFTLLEKK